MTPPIEPNTAETILRVPDLGGAQAVTVIEVLIRPGDRVEPDAPLVTLESDKATMDVPSTASGVVVEVMVGVGDAVSVGSAIARLAGDGPGGGDATAGTAAQRAGPRAAEPYGGEFHTFTGAFADGPQYDETRYARAVAAHVHAVHHEVWPTAAEFAQAVKKRVAGVEITYKVDPARQAILDSWPKRLDDSCARADWGWKASYDLDRMSDDLVPKIRKMVGAF